MSAGDQVRDAVGAAIASSRGEIVEWHGPTARDWSWHFRARARNAESALLIKVPRWEGIATLEAALAAGPQSATAAEYSALEQIRGAVSAANDSGLAAIVPVAYVPAVNAVVMEQLEATPLRTRLGVGRGPADAVEWFAGIGRWLGVYHRLGAGEPAQFSAAAEKARWDSSGGEHPRLRRALDHARTAAESLDGRKVVEGVQHGDLTLGNVLVTGDGKIAVIDPNQTSGRWEADAARLIAETRLGRGQLFTHGVMRRPSVVDRWAYALAEGHGGLDAEVLAYDRGAAALERMIDLLESGPVSRLMAVAASGMFRREFTQHFAA